MANEPEWTFRSTVIDPSGYVVTTTVTVPVGSSWEDVGECSELAQMGANFTAGHVAKSRGRSNKFDEEPPF